MSEIEIYNLKKEIAGHILFEIKEILVEKGARIGLVGPNGQGKSSLLKILIGQDNDYQGKCQINSKFAYLPQLKPVSTMSGGQQTLSELQKSFESNAPILILDEPSTNLDQYWRQWLIDQLKVYSGTLIMASHDRTLLNQTVYQIWELDQGKLTTYHGNYTDYKKEKDQAIAKQAQDYEAYQEKRKQLTREIHNRQEKAKHFKKRKASVSVSDYKVNNFAGGYDGQEKAMAKRAKSLQKRLDKLEEVAAPSQETQYLFKSVGALDPKSKTLLNLEPGEVMIQKRKLFDFNTFKLKMGQKIALTGQNQAGKTTFLRGIVKQIYQGYYSPDLKIGYFAQNLRNLNKVQSVLANVSEHSLQDIYLIKQVLASLGFVDHKLNQESGSLSGGEQVRLSLARILLGDYNLLLLDEPTNFLDIRTLEAVEDFIKTYPGALLMVSHDDAFLQSTCQLELKIKDGHLLWPQYQNKYKDTLSKKIALLEFCLQNLVMDSQANLDEIKALKNKIDELKHKEFE
ncbi:ribosomal protection-like ABC-F family protein [Eremococcus coleocola]|uniref:ABC transporter, ATP-binding protein n=1 Tax=Eremococcus coleocola ACS-139-V-Col8 TaxID=908337 RepID=E4KNT4_9LACT|nr:ATP-binding cassette domain-containing protein [Eremococcus coleocola]EFR31379.1 ABC transporter, ATP-binding protein [Eremococcus coleocola ACS-139-V-Col8]